MLRKSILRPPPRSFFGAIFALRDQPSPWKRIALASGLSLAMPLLSVGIATAGLLLISSLPQANLVPIVYLIPVMIAATRWGIWPAIVAAVASAAAADFFFYPPFYSFRLDDPQAAVNLLLFLLVALISGHLASRLRRETEMLKRSEQELQTLYGLSRQLASCHTVSDLSETIQEYFAKALGQCTVFLLPADEAASKHRPAEAVPRIVHDVAASMMKPGGPRRYIFKDETRQSIWLLRALRTAEVTRCVIAVDIGEATVNERSHAEAILAEAAQTLEHLDIGVAMEEASLRLKNQLLRDAFHNNLSHELRSPLAAIHGSASVLETMPAIKEESRAYPLVGAITGEVERLDSFIGNLLHATRVGASDIRPHLSCADPRDIINAAIRQRRRQLATHSIKVSFEDDLPMVNVDSSLLEEACGQLLENAAKYSPPGSTISVNASSNEERITLSISDEGVGITDDERAQLGQKSFRGERHRTTVSGAGLGFWIASTFVRANNGLIEIASGGTGRGTTACIILPEAVVEEDTEGSSDE